MVKKCFDCNMEVPSDSAFCPYCGSNNLETVDETDQSAKLICSSCKNEIPEDSLFCPYCGAEISHKEHVKDNNAHETTKNADHSDSRKKNLYPLIIMIWMFLLAFVAVRFIYLTSGKSDVPFTNGERVITHYLPTYESSGNNNELLIIAPKEKSLYVCVGEFPFDKDGKYATYLIQADKSYSIFLSPGSYELYYATGEHWKGKERLFGTGTKYYYQNAAIDSDNLESGYHWEIDINTDNNIIEIDKKAFPVK